MKHGACIVETRPLENLKEIISRHLDFLPNDWGFTAICSIHNSHMFPSGFNLIVLPNPNINEQRYNELLTASQFWNEIPYDKCLIFQHDSEIFKPWDVSFEQWDYIGAPWKFQEHGGNGGLSWRSIAAMKWCLTQRAWNPSMCNEDVFFSNILQISDKYKLAPREVCREFSVETIYELRTFGAHAIDKYLTPEECKQIREQYK